MKRVILAVALVTIVAASGQHQMTPATVKGYVIDSACVFVKSLDKPISKECALTCAKAGSPLVILADDGTIYLPISSEMPAKGQNERLMKFAGERVIVTGKVLERGGSHALVIDEIGAEPAAK